MDPNLLLVHQEIACGNNLLGIWTFLYVFTCTNELTEVLKLSIIVL